MKNVGGQCVFSSEIDKQARETYKLNHLQNQYIPFVGDITLVNEREVPEHDILCGGFPCQAFSISGKQAGFADATRGTLFFDIARIAAHHRPKVLFLENVKNLIRHDDGKTLDTIVTTIKNLGYQVYYKVLNASDYGLPQHRERVYIVCFRNDLDVKNFSFPAPTNYQISLHDILDDNANVKNIVRPDIVFRKPDVTQPANKPIQIGIIGKGGQGNRIYSAFGHAITLSAYGGGVGAKTGLYKINDIVRKLTPRECARVQGFPDSFKISDLPTQSYKQFGNSVAIGVVQAIAENIVNVIADTHVSKTLMMAQKQASSMQAPSSLLHARSDGASLWQKAA